MTKVSTLIASEQLQFFVYLAIAVVVIIATAVLYAHNKFIYEPFTGTLNPVLVMVGVALLGFAALTYLLLRGWLAIFAVRNLPGLAVAAALAVLFALLMIGFDSRIILPEDVNRPYPDALLFYPTIGFAAEIIFHVLPLTLLLLITTTLFKSVTFAQLIWPCIFLVALVEPILQTVWGYSRPYPWWVLALIALHIFLFNLAGLALFKRYDFVTMYSFRLVYYLLWHIVWGVVRLQLLF